MKKGFAFTSCWLLVLAITLVIALAQTSIIPFHAKLQRIQQVFGPDGTLESEQIYAEDYTRNSQGSAYTDGKILDSLTGQMQNSAKVLESANDGRIYLIDEGKKTVLISSNPLSMKRFRPPSGGEKKIYLGRTCRVLRNAQEAGELWIDAEIGYPLYERREIPQAGGRKMIRISWVIDLTVNQEPDYRLFRLPSLNGYEIIDRTAK